MLALMSYSNRLSGTLIIAANELSSNTNLAFLCRTIISVGKVVCCLNETFLGFVWKGFYMFFMYFSLVGVLIKVIVILAIYREHCSVLLWNNSSDILTWNLKPSTKFWSKEMLCFSKLLRIALYPMKTLDYLPDHVLFLTIKTARFSILFIQLVLIYN